ncbi:hypothetical protein IAS59_001313 [Cryptococcus gattii]
MRVTFWVVHHLKRVDVKSKIPTSFTDSIPRQFHKNLIPPVILGFSVGFKELTGYIREKSGDVWKARGRNRGTIEQQVLRVA